MIEIKAPNHIPCSEIKTIFLAGSIDMGSAEMWQDRVVELFENETVILLNPRRDDWDSSWVQDISNDKFREQVNWELDGLERADAVLFYFSPSGPAPVTLMELGYVLGLDIANVVVCCPEGYWRRGNVQVMCDRYDVVMVDSIEDFLHYA